MSNFETKCTRCDAEAEYDQPSMLCFNCWTEWWVNGLGIKDKRKRAKELKRVRKQLKEQNDAVG